MKNHKTRILTSCALAIALLVSLFYPGSRPVAQQPAEATFPQADVNYFQSMDGEIQLTDAEHRGRNTWMLWTGGNSAFWDYITRHSFGNMDLLKVLDSRNRGRRFAHYGLVNEPGFKEADRVDEFGLWLDVADGTRDPFYAPSAYQERFPREDFIRIYGRATGVLGARLFPNPNFDAEARQRWDPQRYYNDPSYYRDPDLVRPYRVGMACGFCHVAPDPVRPPANVEAPGWQNITSYIGNQYWWASRILLFEQDPKNFIYQLVNSMPPGTIDTSFVATDNINNPRTINSLYNVMGRLSVAQRERLGGGNLAIPGAQPELEVPHILKDGSDSVGILGALSRVYINIGTHHEEWVRHFNPMVGGRPQTPFPVAAALRASPEWRATSERVGDLAAFFARAAVPHRLQDAPGAQRYLTEDTATIEHGGAVFAQQCAACHSSKHPTPPEGVARFTPAWDAWTRTPDFQRRMAEMVRQPDFLAGNYLSTDRRYPVTEIGTNACSALATNGMQGHVWNDFSSQTYKELPAVGTIQVQHPLTGETSRYEMPGGGRGYHRAPTLVSLWSSAPFFHNNSLGTYYHDPSVEARMRSFQDAVEKLLWPDRRLGMGSIYRTSDESWLVLDERYLPEIAVGALRLKGVIGPDEHELRLGPIPQGTPINLLANIYSELSFDPRRLINLVDVLFKTKGALREIREQGLAGEAATARLRTLVPDLLEVSKCPDFVTDRGHIYGAGLPDADKRALIAFLKRL